MPPEQITFDTFGALCDIAREFNEYAPPERTVTASRAPSTAKGNRPGDDFNRRAGWGDILTAHGWQVERTSGDVTYWTRPGKSRGVSATTGRCRSEAGNDLLYVFTTNAPPFEGEDYYDKFGAHVRLNHGGDFVAATKELAARGYGEPAVEVRLKSVQTLAPTEQLPADDDIHPDFDFATAADLRRLGIELRWTWEGWLQQGAVNLLAAEGGTGKTRFVMDLVRRVVAGDVWPDGKRCPKFDGQYVAMWVAADSNHAELLTLSEQFGVADRIAYSGTKANPTGFTTLDTLGDYLILHRKVKAAAPLFLVVDTCGGATSKNLAKQEDARAFFGPAAVIAGRRKMCVLGLTHLNAQKGVLGRRAEERVRVVIRMSAKAPNDKDCPRRLEVLKSNSLVPPPLGCLLGPGGNAYDVPAPPPPEQDRNGGPAPDTGDPARGPPTKVRECMDWLEDALSVQPQRVYELRSDADRRGFSVGVLYKAKAALELIESEDEDGKKWWAVRH